MRRAAAWRWSLQSVPTEIDVLQRRLLQLQLAQRMLKNETEEHALERLAEVEDEIHKIEKELQDLRGQWEIEKLGQRNVSTLREDLEAVKTSFKLQMDAIQQKHMHGEVPREEEYQALARRTPSGSGSKPRSRRSRPSATSPRRKATGSSRRRSTPRRSPRSSASGPASRSRRCSRPSARSWSSWRIRSTSGWSTRTTP